MKKLSYLVFLVTLISSQQSLSAGSVWSQVSGTASDIGIGANGTIWKIGTEQCN